MIIKIKKVYYNDRIRMYEFLNSKGVKPFGEFRNDSNRTVWLYRTDNNLLNLLNEYQRIKGHPIEYVLTD